MASLILVLENNNGQCSGQRRLSSDDPDTQIHSLMLVQSERHLPKSVDECQDDMRESVEGRVHGKGGPPPLGKCKKRVGEYVLLMF